MDQEVTQSPPEHGLSGINDTAVPRWLSHCLQLLLPPGARAPQVMWGGSAQSLGQKSPSGLQMLVALSSLYTLSLIHI